MIINVFSYRRYQCLIIYNTLQTTQTNSELSFNSDGRSNATTLNSAKRVPSGGVSSPRFLFEIIERNQKNHELAFLALSKDWTGVGTDPVPTPKNSWHSIFEVQLKI